MSYSNKNVYYVEIHSLPTYFINETLKIMFVGKAYSLIPKL